MLKNYNKFIERFDNYEQFFEYEFNNFKKVSEKIIKKISKLYAMAKDDEKVADILTKINSKTTNESILDLDLEF